MSETPVWIVGGLMIAGCLWALISDIRTRHHWKHRCTTCRVQYPNWDGFVGILHGMGPESDCWEEHICPACQAKKPPRVGFLTSHALHPTDFS